MESRPLLAFALAAAIATPLAGQALAGAEKIVFPAGYQTQFVRYNEVDRPDRKIVRVFYVNRDVLQAARAGQPAPYGTVLIMEDRKARLGADGQPMTDADGRFVTDNEVTSVFVMEKRPGWGAEYPPEKRNGEWEYAWFNPDGSPRADARFDGCFGCHKNRAERDYTFTFVKYLLDRK